jgi:hypothetical protein
LFHRVATIFISMNIAAISFFNIFADTIINNRKIVTIIIIMDWLSYSF